MIHNLPSFRITTHEILIALAACAWLIGRMKTTQHWKQLPKWRMYCPQLNLWAGLDNQANIVPCSTPDDSRVQVFDGRDNEVTKLAFYTRITGIKWEMQNV